MNEYDEYLNNKDSQEQIFYDNDNEIMEEINVSNNLSQIEHDILILINYLRTNPLDFCNNLIQKNKYNQNQNEDYSEIISFIKNIHQRQILSEYIEVPEISSAARCLLNNISLHYNKYHDLNFKQFESESLNIRKRLANYGERKGRIYESVLFKMDNPDDIVNHILSQEKGRNMLLNYKMKYIGIACDILPNNYICTVIDLVQDFVPFTHKRNINNDINDNISNNNYNMDNYSLYNYENKSFKNENIKNKYHYNRNNSEFLTLFNNLNYKNNKEKLKLNINIPNKKAKEIEIDLNINNNNEDNIKNLNNFNDDKREIKSYYKKNIYLKTPIKFPLNQFKNKSKNIFSPKTDEPLKKILPKRNNSSNVNILNKDLKIKNIDDNNDNDNDNDNENIKKIKFTMAGRSFKQQQEIIEKSANKNISKSKSVCSLDINSNCSKNSKAKNQKLNYQKKMEILNKINKKYFKTPGTPSIEKISVNLIQNKNLKNLENKYKRSPSKSTYNQENFDIISETDKNNYNSLSKYMNKNAKNNNLNYEDEANQTFTDIKSNIEEFSKNKLNDLKNDLITFKNQIRSQLREEVREEIKNEFNKKLLFEKNKKNKNNPAIINLEGDFEIQNSQIFKNNNNTKKNNELIQKINYNNNNNYYYKNKGKIRWSSGDKYFYIKNNNNINNINNTNFIISDKKRQYSQIINNNYHKRKKSFDLNDDIHNNNNKNNNGIELKEKYRENIGLINYIPNNNIGYNRANIGSYTRRSFHSEYNYNGRTINNNNYNKPFSIDRYKMKNKQEIKQLIRIYNKTKDDKKDKNIIVNKKSYDIININKSLTDYNFNKNNNNIHIKNNIFNKNINIDINENINDNNKINMINYNSNISEKYNNNNIDNKTNISNRFKKVNNEEEEYSVENDFIKGHRFQIKYEKVKPKGHLYNKSQLPKSKKISIKTNNYDYDYDYDNKSNINDNTLNKNDDMVNLGNTYLSNEKEEVHSKENYNEKDGKKKEYKIEKTSYIKKNNEISTYNAKDLDIDKDKKEKINNNINNTNSNDIITGKLIDENNINNDNKKNKINDSVDIKDYMDKNITYEESVEKPIISRKERMEDNNIVTTITTKTRKIYTPTKKGKNEDFIFNKTVHKKESNLIKEYKKYEKIKNNNNINDTRSVDGENQFKNKIISKKLDFGRKANNIMKVNKNNNIINKKTNYIEIENDDLKAPNQFDKRYNPYENIYYNNNFISPRFNNNFATQTYYKKKKYTPYPYNPYESTVYYKDIDAQSKIFNCNNKYTNTNESLEKKYIKGPEGNLIETYVKKTKYNDGSVLLEYV